jgi:hypothetical protein
MLRFIVSILIALLFAALVSAAAITPLGSLGSGRIAKAVCYLDWPVSKATGWMGMSWWGLALFVDDGGGCRGVNPNVPRMLALQALWSVLVYTPVFMAAAEGARRARRRQKAR